MVDHRGWHSRDEYDAAILQELTKRDVGLVCLAGYMRLVGPVLLSAFPNAILNIHPSLLPAFPGMNAQHQAIEHGVKVSGVTVHFVTSRARWRPHHPATHGSGARRRHSRRAGGSDPGGRSIARIRKRCGSFWTEGGESTGDGLSGLLTPLQCDDRNFRGAVDPSLERRRFPRHDSRRSTYSVVIQAQRGSESGAARPRPNPE